MRGLWCVLLLCCSVSGFVVEEFTYCGFGNDKGGNVTFHYLVIFNRQPIVWYNTSNKEFKPMHNLIKQLEMVTDDIIQNLTNPSMVRYMHEKEITCKKEVTEYWESTVQRSVKPSMEVFLPDSFGSQTPGSLVCHVWGFYPSDIRVSWVKNDKIVTINTSAALPLGDWTYQVVALQDLSNSSPDDEYTCVVQHPSLDNMMMRSWKQGLTSAQIVKISISSVLFLLGLITFITGFLTWRWFNKTGYIPFGGYNEAD